MNKHLIKSTSEKQNKQNNKKILLFPGESFQFSRNLLPYNIFCYTSTTLSSSLSDSTSQLSQLTTKKSSLITFNSTNNKTNNSSVLYLGKLYTPTIDDVIIGTITLKTFEFYKVDINTSREAVLNTIDFEGATRKTKPNLIVGDVVFARIQRDNKFGESIITCKTNENNDGNIKNWASGESMFGQLVDGFLYDFNRVYAMSLLSENNYVIHRLKDMVEFECCIGMNGKLWIKCEMDENNEKVYNAIIKSFEGKEDKSEIERYLNNIFNRDETIEEIKL